MKICVRCGREFAPRNRRVNMCSECVNAVDVCPVCGKEKSVHKTACCRSCATKLQIQIKGNPMNSVEAKEKAANTCLERYGSRSSLWGSNRDNTLSRNYERFGGASPFSSESIREKSIKTNLERYGVEFGGGSLSAQIKRDETMMSRYGVRSNKQFHLRNTIDLNREFIEDNFIDSKGRLMVNSIIEYFGYSGWGHVYRACSRLGVNYVRNLQRQQDELVAFIRTLYSGDVVVNTRTLIKPREIDVYIPELCIAFEYNGSYWHSDEVILRDKGMSAKEFHEMKFRMCADVGVSLYFVREEDWVGNREKEEERVRRILLK